LLNKERGTEWKRYLSMFIVNLPRSWPAVVAGHADAEEVTRGSWAQISDSDLEEYGDVLLGAYKNVVVTAYEILSWTRDEVGRVTFEVRPSAEFGDLVGKPVPGTPWVRGAARPVKVLPTEVARGRTVAPAPDAQGLLRAKLGVVTVTADADGTVTVYLAPGSRLVVVPEAADGQLEDEDPAAA
jgi:hypothetical protein